MRLKDGRKLSKRERSAICRALIWRRWSPVLTRKRKADYIE